LEGILSYLEVGVVLFGAGQENNGKITHEVISKDWSISPVTKEWQSTARKQLGTSGGGNHFVEFGVLSSEDGTYDDNLAVLSHSGSRGPGAAVCHYYSKLAKQLHPGWGDRAWLDMDTPEGQEYWGAMNLMGEYATAHHQIIHQKIGRSLDKDPILTIENHHNFAWKENHFGKELIVHRKGATPAGEGELGIIPGSMNSPAYLVAGKGCLDSLNSASHGAGRRYSRSQAKKLFDFKTELDKIQAQGVTVIGAGADELPGAYKHIDEVMEHQKDLVEIVARFNPKIVRMAGAGRG
jgi:tRNA-splicing ligase RtcB